MRETTVSGREKGGRLDSRFLLTATMSVSLSPCSIPGRKPAFSLGEDEMELGLGQLKLSIPHLTLIAGVITISSHALPQYCWLSFSGIHGEAGAQRTKVSRLFLLY